MLKYGKDPVFDPETRHFLNIDRQSLSLIPRGSYVLDIGCTTGFMGEYLKKKKNCTVVGVEMGHEEAQIAQKKLQKVIKGDIENPDTLKKISGKFDIILASAIVEHLHDPETALKTWRKFLKEDGHIIITIPNIAHWSTRLHVLMGRFNYQEYGILDKTHLHFYTIETFQTLVTNAGYNIETLLIDPVGGGFPKISLLLSRFFPGLFAYQMVIKAQVDKPS